MKIDLKSLNEIELDELDLENIGSWPLAVKIIVCIIAAGLVAFFTYSMMVSSEIEAYEQAQQKERVSLFLDGWRSRSMGRCQTLGG